MIRRRWSRGRTFIYFRIPARATREALRHRSRPHTLTTAASDRATAIEHEEMQTSQQMILLPRRTVRESVMRVYSLKSRSDKLPEIRTRKKAHGACESRYWAGQSATRYTYKSDVSSATYDFTSKRRLMMFLRFRSLVRKSFAL